MKYCPRCASPLETGLIGGRERPYCPAPGCGFTFFGDFSIGCGGVVVRDGKVLLIQRGHDPGKGSWQIPGGYVEADEEVAVAVVRECREEAGIEAAVVDVVGFRHSIGGRGSIGGPSTNIYIVFRLTPLGGEPVADGEETAAAGFYALDEIERMDRVQGLTKWAIQRAMRSGPGLAPAYVSTDPSRPGWTLFGIDLPEGEEPVAVFPPPAPRPAEPA
jgi:ADP-ribose pyrophosphatase YjhB (NUDIX family)